ncbi:MAG: hypothetical protein LQ347_003533, partial [Umbilicaria vellea]
MAEGSPVQFASTYEAFPRRPPSRPVARDQAARPHLKRGSPLSRVATFNGTSAPPLATRQYSVGDSSDDELPVPPMKFSAEAKAILGDDASLMDASPPSKAIKDDPQVVSDDGQLSTLKRSGPIAFRPALVEATASPAPKIKRSPRIVRLSAGSTGSATLRRTVSTSNVGSSPFSTQRATDLVTPAPRPRSERIDGFGAVSGSTTASDNNSNSAKLSARSADAPSDAATSSRHESSVAQETAVTSVESLANSRIKTEDTGIHGSLRVKRVGKVTGRFLSGPARRGIIRRQSEEDRSPAAESRDAMIGENHAAVEGDKILAPENLMDASPNKDWKVASQKAEEQARPSHHVRFASQSVHVDDSQVKHRETDPPRSALAEAPSSDPNPILASLESIRPSDKHVQPIFKVPPLPSLPSRYDQENEPPPTFKRNKANGLDLLDKIQRVTVLPDEKMLGATPVTVSPVRKALAPRSQNTPLRPAPPPPKMSMLETATAAASASQSRKKRSHISVNGKLFTRLDKIGRGGSSMVYKVMAENYKMFALKRVNLEDADEVSIRGYKGEIELLRQLSHVERVVRLFDWEVNDERRTLSVLMEMGESDLDRILRVRTQPDSNEAAPFDLTFTRYYWKEMLECVAAVHAHSIVHSDLKPANFLLVSGKLKLIDFGIANAIHDDTVNVHREQTIGTPNYMSPEAISDSNALLGLPASAGKVMKLGRPSDVWSLGCILYQMVYGKAPFAHIANQLARLSAITSPAHVVVFPAHGLGGVDVPPALIRTLKRCLHRDQTLRPTVAQLLSPSDGFLYPDAGLRGTVPVGEEMLGRVTQFILQQ